MTPKNKTGLFFGSFNPIHQGHLMIANYMVEYTDISQVWFIVSPHNPLKEKATLLADHHRLAMANIAVEDDPRFRASNIEFHLPQPSYTIDTLTYLSEKYQEKEFVLICGSDTLPTFAKWKNYEMLLNHYQLYIYPRPGTPPSEFDSHPHVHFTEAPLIEISSSFIRNGIREGKNMRQFLPEKVWKYLTEMHFYELAS
ncbi:MAG: nicotinate (nicotinamide) nucleotide adenylyltransferase [Bacteroidetes bacterium]|nr:nicotinate (nicotinamide) nucleotide adenylyltransferase [Bacteroidota bacterium]